MHTFRKENNPIANAHNRPYTGRPTVCAWRGNGQSVLLVLSKGLLRVTCVVTMGVIN